MKFCIGFMITIIVYKVYGYNTIVYTQKGCLKGTILTSPRDNSTFSAYFGIPYAKPPVGNLRFKDPEPAEDWIGQKDAIEEKNVCPQIEFENKEFIGAEDCLYLNIFTPSITPDSLRPVMVWLSPGGFQTGSSKINVGGPHYIVPEGIVMVTFNYRLNVLGFLNLQNKEVPGNAGMKDQVLALKWVQENIRYFGGDKNNVTIAGQSAGGASVLYHMLSPMSKDLFHNAIAQSGSPLSPWAYEQPNSSLPFQFAEKLGIRTKDKNELLKKLRELPAMDLAKAASTFTTMEQAPIIYFRFVPTIDINSPPGQVFLPDSPSRLLKSRKFKMVPFMTGITSADGMIVFEGIRKILNVSIQKHIESVDFEYFGVDERKCSHKEIGTKIKQFYFGTNNDRHFVLQQYTNLATDLDFFKGMKSIVDFMISISVIPVYVYQFSFVGKMNTFREIDGGSELSGASHADDTNYLLWKTRYKFEIGSPELMTSERMVKLWTNFVKTGNPTPNKEPLLQNIIWKPISKRNSIYLNIDTNLEIGYDLRKQYADFWYRFHKKCGDAMTK